MRPPLLADTLAALLGLVVFGVLYGAGVRAALPWGVAVGGVAVATSVLVSLIVVLRAPHLQRWRFRSGPEILLRLGGGTTCLVGAVLSVFGVSYAGVVVLVGAGAAIVGGLVPPDDEDDGYLDCCLEMPFVSVAPAYTLVFRSGPMAGERRGVIADITTVGSIEGNTICVQDQSLAKRHFGFRLDEGRLEMADFGSPSGTYVNGRKITRNWVEDGDVIRAGGTELVVEYTGPPLPDPDAPVVAPPEPLLRLAAAPLAVSWHPRQALLGVACSDGMIHVVEWHVEAGTLERSWTLDVATIETPVSLQWASHGLSLRVTCESGEVVESPFACSVAPLVEEWLPSSIRAPDGATIEVVGESGLLVHPGGMSP